MCNTLRHVRHAFATHGPLHNLSFQVAHVGPVSEALHALTRLKWAQILPNLTLSRVSVCVYVCTLLYDSEGSGTVNQVADRYRKGCSSGCHACCTHVGRIDHVVELSQA